MAKKAIEEYLRSGEADDIVVAGNIGYLVVQDPQYNGMFQRITNGLTSLYRAKNQDKEWYDDDQVDRTLTTSPLQVLTLVLDEYPIAPDDDATFTVMGSVTNTDNKNQKLFITIKDDGTQLGDILEIPLIKSETDKFFAVSQDINIDIDQDSNITVEFYGSKDGKVILNGDEVKTAIQIILPRAAPVSALATAEKEIVFDDSVGRRPSLDDIKNGLASSDQLDLLDTHFTALATNESGNRFWQVFFDHKQDAFFTHELYKAV